MRGGGGSVSCGQVPRGLARSRPVSGGCMKLKGKYRLLAIDVDGTLLGPDHEISPPTSSALLDAIAAGWVVCICTGRNYTEAKPYLQRAAADPDLPEAETLKKLLETIR